MGEAQTNILDHRLLNGEADYEAAIGEVIDKAERTLHIFDIDLAMGGYNTLERSDALRGFLTKNRSNRRVIVLDETGYLTRNCPRLMNLLGLHSHAISILKTHEHGRVASDPMVIADEAHYVHRFHADGTRGLRAFWDHAGARQLEERFEQLQEAASPAVWGTALGL